MKRTKNKKKKRQKKSDDLPQINSVEKDLKRFHDRDFISLRIDISRALERVENKYGIKLILRDITFMEFDFKLQVEGRASPTELSQLRHIEKMKDRCVQHRISKLFAERDLINKLDKKTYRMWDYDPSALSNNFVMKEAKKGSCIMVDSDYIVRNFEIKE